LPIIERRPARAFKRFRDHIRAVVGKTLPIPAHVRVETTYTGTTGTLEFIRGDGVATAVPLTTRFGDVYFTLTQFLEAVRDGRRYRLTTKGYAYRLLNRDDPTSDAVLRWEYVSDAPHDRWCRHHVQIAATVALAGGALDLNREHAPSGWVTIEEMIRFLIHDLGVAPVTQDWPTLLADSERKFFENFTSKRYKP
jgi:hypothetical protein